MQHPLANLYSPKTCSSVYCGLSDLQGSLSLKLPVGKAVVQSLSFHPTETLLLTAMEGRVQVWGAEPEETEESAMAT